VVNGRQTLSKDLRNHTRPVDPQDRPSAYSSKFHGGRAPTILHMLELKLLIFLALRMEVNATDTAGTLVEANVVESFETGSSDRLNAVIRHQEVFFPAHEKMFSLEVIFERKVWRLS